MKRVGERGGGKRSQLQESEEVKISHRTDKDKKEGNQEGEIENGKGEETTACLRRGAGPF